MQKVPKQEPTLEEKRTCKVVYSILNLLKDSLAESRLYRMRKLHIPKDSNYLESSTIEGVIDAWQKQKEDKEEDKGKEVNYTNIIIYLFPLFLS
jgi:hypothetical protein